MAGAFAVEVAILRLPHAEGLDLPEAASPESAGVDLRAAVSTSICIEPLERHLVPTGLCFEIPVGWEVQIRPRSGLALRHGVTVLNSPGTIDSDYRGEVGVLLINLGSEPYTVVRGHRIAQAILAPTHTSTWVETDQLTGTSRGDGGFGSTGVD
ncbi:MAG: dUTP diphosphatase [Thermoanaerobaculia bacterium]|nr:dUTP diphosphatase [Thermoanaerobaculia bacterium]